MKTNLLSTLILTVSVVISIAVPAIVVAPTVYFPMEPSELIYLLGRLFGLVAFFIISFQYLWTAKLRILERIRSYDGRVSAHRTMGFLGILLLSLHPIFVLMANAMWGIGFVITLPIGLGFIAFIVLLVIAGSTFLGRIWGVKYETWKKIHWLNFAVLTIAFIHSLQLGSDVKQGPTRVLWFVLWVIHLAILLGKFIHKFNAWRTRVKIVGVRKDSPDTMTLTLENPRKPYVPGQFAFLSLPIQGTWSSWHPFSLTSHPKEDELSMTIKASGDFTGQIRNLQVGETARIDVGYGAFSPIFARDKRYIFIAGGVGITPIYAVLKELRQHEEKPDLVLNYCVQHEGGILFREDLDTWFSEHENWKINYICSRQADWPGPKGRLTPDMLSELLDGNFDATFFLCGPIGLVSGLVRYLSKRGVPKSKIRREQFVFLP